MGERPAAIAEWGRSLAESVAAGRVSAAEAERRRDAFAELERKVFGRSSLPRRGVGGK